MVQIPRDLDTDQTSTEQKCGRTDQNGKKYVQHHMQRWKDQHLGLGEKESLLYNQQSANNEIVLGRAISTASKMTDGSRVSSLGDHIMTRKDGKGDQPSGGKKT